METILLYGTEMEAGIAETLLAFIRAAGKTAFHFTQEGIFSVPPGAHDAGFLLVDRQDCPLHTGRGVVVFRPGLPRAAVRGDAVLPDGFIAVMDSARADAAGVLQHSSLPVVTCGMSQKDSLTFSSIGPDSAVISLLRSVRSLDGEVVEPREIPVSYSDPPSSPFALLAAAAVLALTGQLPDAELRL